jgi:hypothetical protein
MASEATKKPSGSVPAANGIARLEPRNMRIIEIRTRLAIHK